VVEAKTSAAGHRAEANEIDDEQLADRFVYHYLIPSHNNVHFNWLLFG
jgi:hypothetical protein